MVAPLTDTTTPGSAAPLASSTVPEMPPVMRCARTGDARTSVTRADPTTRRLRMGPPSTDWTTMLDERLTLTTALPHRQYPPAVGRGWDQNDRGKRFPVSLAS